MENPFSFGDVVTGDEFADREEELELLEMDLVSGQNVILESGRRFGKSSLLKELYDSLGEVDDCIPVYIGIFDITSVINYWRE